MHKVLAILAGALVLALVSSADAQQKRPGASAEPESSLLGTGKPCIGSTNLPLGCTPKEGGIGSKVGADIANTLAKPFTALADFIADDTDAALALATAIPDLQDGHGQGCWIATKAFSDVVKAHPIPLTLHALTDLEGLRLLTAAAQRVCANVHCTQVFADLATGVQVASPVNLSVPLPSLHDICAKIPQIEMVAPVAMPAAPPAQP